MARAIGVIPARYASTRFPGKPLAAIHGKPMLQWVVEAARKSQKLDDIYVATDHDEIFALGESLGVKTVMTDPDLATGSDRVWKAIQSEDADVVINIQGDEPLLNPEILDALVTPMLEQNTLDMATLARPFRSADEVDSEQTAKIILNEQHEAIYFSRLPIPFSREKTYLDEAIAGCVKHIGLYAYRKSFLQRFCAQAPTAIEKAEGLEQLRALYLGARIKVVMVESESWGVDTPSDIKKVEEILGNKKYR